LIADQAGRSRIVDESAATPWRRSTTGPALMTMTHPVFRVG
jgi:hypothetical protein